MIDDNDIGALFWYEPDGWRGWKHKDNGSYYFHDVPEDNLTNIMMIFCGLDKE